MKKICFITVGNVEMAPYIGAYSKLIDYPYSVICWEREKSSFVDGKNTYYRFLYEVKPGERVSKILGYVKYREFISDILRRESFDILILLQSWSAILISDILNKYYKGKFIVDIRDYTHELSNRIIYQIEKRTFRNAILRVISSNAYKEFLPPMSYINVHNNRTLPEDKVKSIRNREKRKECLNIAYIGYANYQEQHKKLLLALKNDDRFHVSFIGTRSEELLPFCEKNNIKNVTISGKFDSDSILSFYENADFVNNLYGNNNPSLDFAISNKLYFAAELRIPILVSPKTYMSRVASEYEFGLEVDLENARIGDQLWEYYNGIDWDRLDKGCKNFLEKVEDEQRSFENQIKNIVR